MVMPKEILHEDVGLEPRLEWGELGPLPELAPDPPDITPDMLPEALRSWIQDAAQRASVHLAFIAVAAIVSAGSVIGRSVGIYPKQRDDWQEAPNIWGAIVAPPSSLKSHAIQEGAQHVRRLAAKAQEEFSEAQANANLDAEVVKLELAQLKAQAKNKKANLDDFKVDMKAKMQELDDLTTIAEKRYIVNDTTMEKAGELLKDNPRGLLYVKDELVGLLKACNKPGNETMRPFLLEAWNGKGSYSFDRIGRGTLHIPAVTLSLLGGIQPGKLRSYITGAVGAGEGADGLLQRFQMLVWFDRAAPWRNVDARPNQEARDKAFEIFEFLDKLGDSDHIQKESDAQHSDIPGVRFEEAAQASFNSWLNTHMIELRGRDLESSPAFQAHLAKYPSMVASLALIFHLIDLAGHRELGNIPKVSQTALELALMWTSYLRLHAEKLYATEINGAVISAHALAERINMGELESGADISKIPQRKWSSLKNKAEVDSAISKLEEVNWVQVVTVRNQGARASRVLLTNPDWIQDKEEQ